ncbi:Transcription factor Tfb4 [Penicillium atrosanguineum]|uniref:General transcription and DNA repair factor IIH subunit TFB4 n=1 Tax=Penicillium atrosanguineum TaxID=1132637 RepID=A0A9W9QBN4_9EURO|nr:short-chain dehydrogenase [Penicillium atrosanguineum]KAJ5127788.1 Transcription factor Tfb4 [Penicillium atrosanguineum]KAJ5147997.1 Transcription factor Tfb4 [Penicillium atrosanguineum]KAJ5313532.1 short-chain dehydrogenase [Penicillium atrosanguineum]KAJ5330706.1 Transcription factor Tfb4 [Penicillium atrosanguineum]
MNSVDASEHYELGAIDLAPSLLTVVIDTNPHAWAALEDSLPLSKAVANILVFINAHLACNYANEVAVVASHSQKAAWLYPVPNSTSDREGDITMNANGAPAQMNKYRPFRVVEEQVTRRLKDLMDSTSSDDLKGNTSTMLAGALTLVLSHINRRTIAWAEEHGGASLEDAADSGAGSGANRYSASNDDERLQSRILIVSVSGSSDSAHQYIPVMNSIFACQRLQIPIDVCKLSGDAVFLQQACDATKGIYMALSEPRGLLQYLMMAFLPDQRSRRHLVLPTREDVDFRAACFCHRRVVNIGFVCSICLSIFCEAPPGGACLTCGTELDIGEYDVKPALMKRKKKKKKPANGTSAAGTPVSTPTPGP